MGAGRGPKAWLYVVKTIRHEKDADDALDEAILKWPGAEDVWEAATWTISRDPVAGMPLTESGNVRAYTIPGAQSADWPTLTVFYRIDGETISIETAKFETAKYVKAGHA